MSKKNVLLRVGFFMLIATFATGGIFTSTYARYAAELSSAETSIRAGLFSVKANTVDFADGTAQLTANFGPLLDTLDWPSAPESVEHVKPIDGTVIAPGTGGRIRITLQNDSEVDVRFFLDSAIVDFTGLLENANIQFSHNNHDIDDWYSNPGDALVELIEGKSEYRYTVDIKALAGEDDTETFDLYWRWRFSPDTAQDIRDTNIGTAANIAAQEIKMALQIKAQQVD